MGDELAPLVLPVVLPLLLLDAEGICDEMLRLGLEEVERDDLLLDLDFLPPEFTFDFLLFAIVDLHAGDGFVLVSTI